jgi:hypothetical protein
LYRTQIDITHGDVRDIVFDIDSDTWVQLSGTLVSDLPLERFSLEAMPVGGDSVWYAEFDSNSGEFNIHLPPGIYSLFAYDSNSIQYSYSSPVVIGLDGLSGLRFELP